MSGSTTSASNTFRHILEADQALNLIPGSEGFRKVAPRAAVRIR
jgi:hypothetical protein